MRGKGLTSARLIPVHNAAGEVALAHDEHIRPDHTLEGLAALKPAFARIGEAQFDAMALAKYPEVSKIEHVHTAGNASGIVDGAAVVLVGSAAAGAQLGLMPRARIRAAALVGTEPTIMLTGPGPARARRSSWPG
jgi:acetyl-CoA C-acetyltransferase